MDGMQAVRICTSHECVQIRPLATGKAVSTYSTTLALSGKACIPVRNRKANPMLDSMESIAHAE